MSNYGIDQAKLEAALLSARRLIELTTEDPGATAPDLGVMAAKIADAEALFENYAGVYYALPVRLASDPATPPPGIVTDLVYATAYMLMTRRPELLGGDEGEGRYWRDAWKEIRTRWEAIGRAKDPAPIVGATPLGDAARASGRGAEAVAGVPAQFTRSVMGRF